MNYPSKKYWAIPALNELTAFPSANGKHEDAVTVVTAAAVVGSPPPLISAPVVEGKIIRFSVHSRDRR